MVLCAAILGIQILLFGVTLPAFISSILISGLVSIAMRATKKEASNTLQHVITSLTESILPELEQQIYTLQQHSSQTFADASNALERLEKCRDVLDKLPEKAPKEIKLALQGITLMQKEISKSLSEGQSLEAENKQLMKGMALTKRALKRASFSCWKEEDLLASIKSKQTRRDAQRLN